MQQRRKMIELSPFIGPPFKIGLQQSKRSIEEPVVFYPHLVPVLFCTI